MNTTGVYEQNICGKTCTVSYPIQLVLTRDQDQYFSGSHTFSPTATAKSWASLFVSPCPPECYLKSETKIEPDLRLNWSRLNLVLTLVTTIIPQSFAQYVFL